MKKWCLMVAAMLCLMIPTVGSAQGLPDFLQAVQSGLSEGLSAGSAAMEKDLALSMTLSDSRVEESRDVTLTIRAENPRPAETGVSLTLNLPERLASSGPSALASSVYMARISNGPIFCSMRRSFSSPLQFLPMSAPVFTSHFVPISVGTPSSFAAYCSSNSGDAEAMTIGRSRGLSKNHLPSLARVASACQKSSASVSRLKRLAISPKSTLLNCVRLRLPAASRSDVPRNFGRPARTPGWRRRQNRVKSTVESPS